MKRKVILAHEFFLEVDDEAFDKLRMAVAGSFDFICEDYGSLADTDFWTLTAPGEQETPIVNQQPLERARSEWLCGATDAKTVSQTLDEHMEEARLALHAQLCVPRKRTKRLSLPRTKGVYDFDWTGLVNQRDGYQE